MKRYAEQRIGNYKIEVRDYQYKSRPPVGVSVSGRVDNECLNAFGEPCYFYESSDAMSMEEGLRKGQAIVAKQTAKGERIK